MIKKHIFWLFFLIYSPMLLAQNIDRANNYFYAANTISQVKNADSNRLIKAINLYTKALVMRPEYWQAYRNRARLNFRLKKYKNALSDATMALKYTTFANNPDIMILRGQCYYELTQFSRAIKDFNAVLPFVGDKNITLMWRAKTYWQLGEKDKACIDYQTVIASESELQNEMLFIDCL
jgi:tetratricopeptide (TPR) repeat protein